MRPESGVEPDEESPPKHPATSHIAVPTAGPATILLKRISRAAYHGFAWAPTRLPGNGSYSRWSAGHA
jgi:hypothetical protein